MSSDKERGARILKARDKIINNGARLVEQEIRELLETGDWRSYTYPDGTHHEWLDREFDYFMCAWIAGENTEWELVKRNIVSPDVKLMLADHSGTTETKGIDRRSVEDVRNQFPHVHIETINLVGKDERGVAKLGPKARAKYVAGDSAHKIVRKDRQRWIVHHVGSQDLAAAIVAKLAADPELERNVYRQLHARCVTNARKRAPQAGTIVQLPARKLEG